MVIVAWVSAALVGLAMPALAVPLPSEGSPDENRILSRQAVDPGNPLDLDPPLEPNPLYASLYGTRFQDAEVASMMELLGLPEDETRQWMSLSAWSPEIVAQARSRFPDTYAGAYLVEDPGGKLILSFTSDAHAKAEAVGMAVGRPDEVVGELALHSAEELEQLYDLVWYRFDELYATAGLVGFYTSDETNGFHFQVLEVTPAAMATLLSLIGDVPATFERSAVGEDTGLPSRGLGCDVVWDHCNPLRGGTTLHYLDAPQTYADCTLGFNATSAGTQYVLTAGHCQTNTGNPWAHSGATIGQIDRRSNGGNTDSARIPVHSQWGNTSRWVIHDGSQLAQAYQIQGVFRGNTNLTSNSAVCISGANSAGTGCIRVLNGNFSKRISSDGMFRDYHNLIRHEHCVQIGDSGGPVYAGYTAYGLLKGRETPGSCFTVSTYVRHAESALTVTVKTN